MRYFRSLSVTDFRELALELGKPAGPLALAGPRNEVTEAPSRASNVYGVSAQDFCVVYPTIFDSTVPN